MIAAPLPARPPSSTARHTGCTTRCPINRYGTPPRPSSTALHTGCTTRCPINRYGTPPRPSSTARHTGCNHFRALGMTACKAFAGAGRRMAATGHHRRSQCPPAPPLPRTKQTHGATQRAGVRGHGGQTGGGAARRWGRLRGRARCPAALPSHRRNAAQSIGRARTTWHSLKRPGASRYGPTLWPMEGYAPGFGPPGHGRIIQSPSPETAPNDRCGHRESNPSYH